MKYFETLAYGPNDDVDEDGYDNKEEYKAKSNPSDSKTNPKTAQAGQSDLDEYIPIVIIIVIVIIIILLTLVMIKKRNKSKEAQIRSQQFNYQANLQPLINPPFQPIQPLEQSRTMQQTPPNSNYRQTSLYGNQTQMQTPQPQEQMKYYLTTQSQNQFQQIQSPLPLQSYSQMSYLQQNSTYNPQQNIGTAPTTCTYCGYELKYNPKLNNYYCELCMRTY